MRLCARLKFIPLISNARKSFLYCQHTNGQIVISCQFDRTVWFSEGLATVRIGDKCGYINANGQIVIPYQFDNAESFSEGLAKVTISGKDYLIDKTGKIVY